MRMKDGKVKKNVYVLLWLILFMFLFVIRSKMKIEDIKEANKALQVE